MGLAAGPRVSLGAARVNNRPTVGATATELAGMSLDGTGGSRKPSIGGRLSMDARESISTTGTFKDTLRILSLVFLDFQLEPVSLHYT